MKVPSHSSCGGSPYLRHWQELSPAFEGWVGASAPADTSCFHRADEVAMIMTNLEKANQVSWEVNPEHPRGLDACPQKWVARLQDWEAL